MTVIARVVTTEAAGLVGQNYSGGVGCEAVDYPRKARKLFGIQDL